MKTKRDLPAIVDLAIEVDRPRSVWGIELFTPAEPTQRHAAAVRSAFLPALFDIVDAAEVRLAKVPDGGRRAPGIDGEDPCMRMILGAVISILLRPRLLRHAERCVAGSKRETVLTAEDLLQSALVLWLAGKLWWRGSLARLESTMCSAIRKLSANARRCERVVASLEAWPLRRPRTSHDPDREAYRVLLQSDVHAALGRLTDRQEAVVTRCWIYEATAPECAADEGMSASTARVHLHRAKPVLQNLLRAYAPSADQSLSATSR